MKQEEKDIIMSQAEEALRLIQAAKIVLLRNRPFYGALIGSLPMYPDCTWLPTAATDGRNIYYNPEFICGMDPDRYEIVIDRLNASGKPQAEIDKAKLYIDTFYRKKTMPEIIFVLEHELRHVVNSHIARGKNFIHDLFNIAADHYTNTHLILEHSESTLRYFPQGKKTVFDHKSEFGFMLYGCADFKYHGWTAEAIYADLLKKQKEKHDKGEKPDDSPKVGKHMSDSQANNEIEEDILGYESAQQPVLTQEQMDRNCEISQRNIANAAQAAGNACPEDIRKLVGGFGKPQIDYVSLIRKRLMSLISHSRSYRRPSRRSAALTNSLRGAGYLTHYQNTVMPGKVKEKTIDVVIGFDVSGSINDDMLKRIFREIMSLTTLYKAFRITLFCWSTKVGNVMVYDEKNIRDIMDYKVVTTGGTHVSCAYEYIDGNIPDAKEVIIFTDGYIETLNPKCEWAKKYSTLWVIFGNPGFKEPFGTKVDFDENRK